MKKIIIFTGDPNSVNSEIIFKCWRKISNSLKKKIYFISNFQLLKKQFRKLALKYHPDKCKDKKTGEKKFKEIFEAYETIKNSVAV